MYTLFELRGFCAGNKVQFGWIFQCNKHVTCNHSNTDQLFCRNCIRFMLKFTNMISLGHLFPILFSICCHLEVYELQLYCTGNSIHYFQRKTHVTQKNILYNFSAILLNIYIFSPTFSQKVSNGQVTPNSS